MPIQWLKETAKKWQGTLARTKNLNAAYLSIQVCEMRLLGEDVWLFNDPRTIMHITIIHSIIGDVRFLLSAATL